MFDDDTKLIDKLLYCMLNFISTLKSDKRSTVTLENATASEHCCFCVELPTIVVKRKTTREVYEEDKSIYV